MFEITIAPGAWSSIARPLIEEVSPAWSIFFVGYVSVVTFAIIRVITAVFLRETLQVATNDNDLMIAERILQKNKYMENVKALWEDADLSGDGTISEEEFSRFLEDP